MYETSYEQLDINVYPTDGITECGVHVKLYPATKGRAQQGVYVSDDHMLTCIRCLSGCSTDGASFRAEQKNLLFAQRYGKNVTNVSGRLSYGSRPQGPPLQNIPPPKVQGHRVSMSYVDEVQVYAPWLAAWAASLPKP